MLVHDPRNLPRVVRWNTFILAACTAINYSIVQLAASLAAIIASALTGDAALAGIAPSVFLAGTAGSAFIAGRLMDRYGRVPVMAGAFVVGAAGALVVFVSVGLRAPAPFFVGITLVGVTNGAVALGRAAAADMYPPEHRGRGIGLVLVGAAVGVVGGGLLFGSLLGGSHGDLATLAAPWPIAAGLMALGGAVMLSIRVDPLTIGQSLRAAAVETNAGDAVPLGAGEALPGVEEPPRALGAIFAPAAMRSALAAVIVAQVVMTAAMSLIPLVMQTHQHDLGTVSLTISSHLVGMFVLSPLLGPLTDRVGRGRALVGGLAVLAAAVLALELGESSATLLPAMFLVGVGWNISYVAASVLISNGAAPQERGKALGSADLISLLAAATSAAVAGALLARVGFGPLAASAAVLAVLPALVLWRLGRGRSGWSMTPAQGGS